MKTYILKPLAVMIGLQASAAIAIEDTPAKEKTDSLQLQLDAIKIELQQVKAQNDALAAQQERQATTTTTAAPQNNLSIFGYGEAIYSRPGHQTQNTVADMARAVFGFGYRFDEKTNFISEFEVEHAVSSADDEGEVEVEQFAIDHKINAVLAVKGGLFLIPAGLLNESHESPYYYGANRNFVETLIIPSTWREGGVAAHGNANGLNWDVGLTTGSNISNWEINPESPRFTTAFDLKDGGPLQATHQELANANAQHLSQYVALNYRGLPGFGIGGSVFTGNMGKFQNETPNQKMMLWELHTRWTPGKLDLSAVYARGTFSNTEDVNLLYPGATNPMPASFYGAYLQAAYSVWEHGNYRLAPFVRVERFNIGEKFEGVAHGLTDDGLPTEQVLSYGANFYLNPKVAVKVDYQKFDEATDFNRFNLGLGVAL